MLYDHTLDPGENRNLSERPENQALVAELAAMLETGWQDCRPR